MWCFWKKNAVFSPIKGKKKKNHGLGRFCMVLSWLRETRPFQASESQLHPTFQSCEAEVRRSCRSCRSTQTWNLESLDAEPPMFHGTPSPHPAPFHAFISCPATAGQQLCGVNYSGTPQTKTKQARLASCLQPPSCRQSWKAKNNNNLWPLWVMYQCH